MIGHEGLDPNDKKPQSDAYRAARAEIAREKDSYTQSDYAHFLPLGYKKYCMEVRMAPDVALLEWEKSLEYRLFIERQLLSQISGNVGTSPEKLSTYFAMFLTLLGYSPLRKSPGGPLLKDNTKRESN